MQTKVKDESLLNEVKETNDKIANIAKEIGLDDMPLNCLADYVRYNQKARGLNKKLRVCRHPVKQCPIDLHPKQRVIINCTNQSNNDIPVYLFNEMIDFKQKLTPGMTYDLPLCIVDHLADRGEARWEQIKNPDGSSDTRKAGNRPRFAIRSVYQG